MKNTIHKIISLFLCVALLVGYLPLRPKAATPALVQSAVTGTITDPGTAANWETMMGTAVDGNRYAGRVWVDKSVYKDGDVAVFNSRGESGSTYNVSLREDEAFQIIFSALGSTMTTKSTVVSSGPMDVVLVLDDSTSMDDRISGNTTRLEKLIEASNKLLADLLSAHDIRIGIVAYNYNSIQVLPFGRYENGVELRVLNNKYTFDEGNSRDKGGTIQAFDRDGNLLYNNTKGYARGTNLQAGFDAGMLMLQNATDVKGRQPVAIVLTDGASNTAVQNTFYNIAGQTPRSIFSSTVASSVAIATLLTASYRKTQVEYVYGTAPMIYGIGVDIDGNAAANAIINPGAAENGFNSANTDAGITRAYQLYNEWLKGTTIRRTESYNGAYQFVFDHGYSNISGVTLADIERNIHYVDTYYPVSSAELNDTFEQIYDELSSSAFNPISSSTSVSGGTGVDDTPLIYVDFIGQHMEIKEITGVTLFGASYGVLKHNDGTYTVTEATGYNPTTNERWNTAEDILITVLEQADGTQKLEIRINQEILPIILEQVVSETVGDVTVSTITELLQDPLRVFYTVGIDSDILLPNGEVDVSKIQGYKYIDDTTGTVSFYSNQFGVMNPADETQTVAKGDAHVGFRPSEENRFYYHQTNQGIFTGITDKNGKAVTIPENNEYGIIWNDADYDLSWMTYAEYSAAKDTDKVYTYVTYYRPTPSTADAANVAEEITYLVYTEWLYLKESVAFYDASTKTYLNNGYVIEPDQVASTVDAYIQSNPGAQIYAVLGIGSRRTSRLHNMVVDKVANNTQTAIASYTPEYLEEKELHNDNDVAVWLGNNGKLTVQIDTGIALTKSLTEPIGDAADTYALTVTVPAGVMAAPVVVDADGNVVASTYSGNVLTVHVKADQTVYISGIPGGTECEIGEIVSGEYYIASKTDKVRIPLVSEALNGAMQFVPAYVTNAPYKYGNLYITKEITSDHAVPESIQDTAFEITVHFGPAFAGETFQVKDSVNVEPYNVTVDDSGNMGFTIKATQTIEILNLPAGTEVTVTEAEPGNHFAVSYRTRNHSGTDADTDNAVVIPAGGSATAVILNRYTPTPVSVDLDIVGTKNFVAEGNHDGGTFTYKVQKWNGNTWVDISGKSAQTTYGANETGEKYFTMENVLSGIAYTEVGNHAYRVIEVKGDVANVTYDRTVFTFDVAVTDSDGQLVATVTDRNYAVIADGSYEVTFRNTYHTAPVSLDVKKIVENKSGDETVSAAGFEFKAVRTDAQWNALTGSEAESFSIYSDAAGNARFTSVCTKAGTYYFTLTEVGKNAPGWTYSTAAYHITVTVTEENGDLSASLTAEKVNSQNGNETVTADPEDTTRATVSFVNTYDPTNVSIDLDGAVRKVLTGKTLEADQFTFYVFKDGDRSTPILSGTNDLNGDVQFVDFDEALIFDRAGKYQYDIVEHIPSGAVYDSATDQYVLNGMRYDPTIYDLVVEVTNDTATGELSASYYFEDAVSRVVTFYNSYKAAPTEYALGGVKVLHGRAPRDGEFSFALYEGDTLIETVTNKPDGSFTFRKIPYDAVGIYTYTIQEHEGNVPGVRYDGAANPVTVTVTVTDIDGTLQAAASINNEEIKFENTYTPNSAWVTFDGMKELVGGTLTDHSFTFQLYSTDNSFDITGESAKLLGTTQNVSGKFSLGSGLHTAGTYYFVVAEEVKNDSQYVYDRTHHKFYVNVTDVGDGQLKAAVTNVVTGASSGSAASVSTGVAFTNATKDEATEKEVYHAGNTSTQIDGQKVNEGDILAYYITYTNYTGEDVVADIMDTIPNHTSYVEGSASHNGTYAGTHVNWILNVAKGESVTVSFQVRVNDTKAVVANTAVVRDGVNTYTTNEVVNHTIDHQLEKDVFSPADDTVSIDGSKVYAGDELLYKISFTNISCREADIQITDAIPANATYVDGSADKGGVFDNGVITWNITDIPAWATVTVTFKVRVNQGVGATTIRNQATASDGTNTYESNWVSNYTVEDEVTKKVYNAKAPGVNIDGKFVPQGETLIYAIRYKNTASEKITVTITDTIPDHTAYVEGSADNGGVYADGVITWTLEIEAGAEVTVSFKVKIDQLSDATLRNQASAVEGKNSYTTNEVTNPTGKPEIPSNPQTGDHMQLYLWIAILFVSGGVLTATLIIGNKKKEPNEA